MLDRDRGGRAGRPLDIGCCECLGPQPFALAAISVQSGSSILKLAVAGRTSRKLPRRESHSVCDCRSQLDSEDRNSGAAVACGGVNLRQISGAGLLGQFPSLSMRKTLRRLTRR